MNRCKVCRCGPLVIGLTCLLLGSPLRADEPPAVDLQVGDVAPLFESTDEKGKAWKLRDQLGKKFVVVYFYPADFTGGCIRQAEAWRDNMNAVAKAGVAVVGISGDSVKNHKLFKKTWKLNFTLLADEKSVVANKYGVPTRKGGQVRPRGPDRKLLLDECGKPLRLERKATFSRWTFVIGKDGKIAYMNRKVYPARDSEQVLEFIRNRESAKQ